MDEKLVKLQTNAKDSQNYKLLLFTLKLSLNYKQQIAILFMYKVIFWGNDNAFIH